MNYRIGIDLGGTDIKAGVVDGNYAIIAKHSRPTLAQRPYAEVIRDMASAASAAAQEAGIRLEDCECVGVGTPGFVNSKTDRIVFAGNLNWREVPLKRELMQYVSAPVFVGNDANCAVIGETLAGAARGLENVVLITLGTGVGGGVVIDGKMFCGGDGMGTELGHTPLILGGEACTCGLRGCFEAYASVTALIRQTKRAMQAHPESIMNRYAEEKGEVNGRTSFDCAKRGDMAALAVVDQYIEYVAAGIGGLVCIFRPDVVLVAGAISNEREYLFDPLNEKIGRYVFANDAISAPRVLRATLGNDAGLIGAAFGDRLITRR
ncbi:MAG: ROK family protein [Oscillospiraceae bacterium]|nr:ROK family protein [Oscillospiraceae bacterium]